MDWPEPVSVDLTVTDCLPNWSLFVNGDYYHPSTSLMCRRIGRLRGFQNLLVNRSRRLSVEEVQVVEVQPQAQGLPHLYPAAAIAFGNEADPAHIHM